MKNTTNFYIVLAISALLLSGLACQAVTGGSKSSDPPTKDKAPANATTTHTTTTTNAVATDKPSVEVLRQWAVFAVASSEYDNPDWAALQATGDPDETECGDKTTAWASAKLNGVDWLELLYEKPVYPDQINIYQNNLPDQVVKVELIDQDLKYHTVYTGQPAVTEECPYILTVNTTNVDYLVAGVKLTVDQSILNSSWDEIDAVELVGRYSGETIVEIPTAVSHAASGSASSDYELPDMSPDSLPAGAFYYEVAGAGEDAKIDKGTLQDQSTIDEYVIGFVSQNFRYAVSLFLPHGLTPGAFNVQKYDRSAFTKNPGAAIYIGAGYYYADGGLIMIESVTNNLVSGSFVFVGTSEYDSSRIVTVSGVFNGIPLVNK